MKAIEQYNPVVLYVFVCLFVCLCAAFWKFSKQKLKQTCQIFNIGIWKVNMLAAKRGKGLAPRSAKICVLLRCELIQSWIAIFPLHHSPPSQTIPQKCEVTNRPDKCHRIRLQYNRFFSLPLNWYWVRITSPCTSEVDQPRSVSLVLRLESACLASCCSVFDICSSWG